MGSTQIGNIIQKIWWIGTGEEIDRSFLKECIYTETVDLSGPRLSLLFDDPDSILTDSPWFKIKIGDVLEIIFEDPTYRKGLNVVIRFIILTMPKDGIRLTMHCFQEDVYKLKMPAPEARLFVQKPVREILRELIPGLKSGVIQDRIGNFPVVEDYHLLPGMRPSLLIRQMAKEHGAVAFFSRNVFCFQRLVDLRNLNEEERIYYEWNNIQAENQIVHMDVMNVAHVVGDRILRKYIGWHMVKGFVSGDCISTDAPVEFAGVGHEITLSNMVEFTLLLIDLAMIGDGRLEPGLALKFGWHLDDKARPFDESLPTTGVVGVVCHYHTGDQYNCRTKIVVPLDGSQVSR